MRIIFNTANGQGYVKKIGARKDACETVKFLSYIVIFDNSTCFDTFSQQILEHLSKFGSLHLNLTMISIHVI